MKRKVKRKAYEIKFPGSRELFLFARKIALYELKREEGLGDSEISEEFIKDIEIGRLIDYDYKYTHQWKFGKKKVHDIGELKSLAENLGVSLNLVASVALGELNSEEAFQVFLDETEGKFKVHTLESVGKSGKAVIKLFFKKSDETSSECIEKVESLLRDCKLS